MMQQTINLASNYTTYITEGIWKGQKVEVDSCFQCPIAGHNLGIMTNYGHPTEYLMCYGGCGGAALNPDPPECTWEDCWCRVPPEQEDAWFKSKGA